MLSYSRNGYCHTCAIDRSKFWRYAFAALPEQRLCPCALEASEKRPPTHRESLLYQLRSSVIAVPERCACQCALEAVGKMGPSTSAVAHASGKAIAQLVNSTATAPMFLGTAQKHGGALKSTTMVPPCLTATRTHSSALKSTPILLMNSKFICHQIYVL